MQDKNKNLIKDLEAILFYYGEGVAIDKLLKILDCNKTELKESIESLKKNYNKERGIVLVESESEIALKVNSDKEELLKNIEKEDENSELSKASLETLSIIIYSGPVSRKDIDYTRGVNSQAIIRSLLLRDLIERVEEKNKTLYRVSLNLLSHLGLQSVSEMPEYALAQENLKSILAQSEEEKK